MAGNDVFVDTSGFFALWVADDRYHSSAVDLQEDLARKRRRFITTDYIVDETATLLLMRHSRAAAADFLQTMEESDSVQIEWITRDYFADAQKLFLKHTDKEWSFTDCVSFAVMKTLKIREALTTDSHFKQAGFVPLLK